MGKIERLFFRPGGWYSPKQAVAYYFFKQFEDYLLKNADGKTKSS
ncbi:MAG: hypothetical protein WA139_03170 [Candidatus Aenigmatarchaeota archaeon]